MGLLNSATILLLITVCSAVIDQKSVKGVRCDDKNISPKARRHFCSDYTSTNTRTSDPVIEETRNVAESTTEAFEDDDDYYYDDGYRSDTLELPEDPITYKPEVITKDPSGFMDDEVEYCDDLLEGFDDMSNCVNETKTETEVRWRDVVFEKLISQSWRDLQHKINTEQTYAGVKLEPLYIDDHATTDPPVNISQSAVAYSIDLQMWKIEIHGLSQIYLNQVLVTRAKNLFDFDLNVQFKFDKLVMNGTYRAAGSVGGWFGTSFSSDGDRSFTIEFVNATINPRLRLDTSLNKNLECQRVRDVLISEIGVPLKYDDISINFTNLGYAANTAINGLSIFAIKAQEQNLLSLVMDQVKNTVNSLIC